MTKNSFKLARVDRLVILAAVSLLDELEAASDDTPTAFRIGGYRFKRICERNKSVYKCPELGMVVKRFAFIFNWNTPLRVRVPTIRLHGGWVVQPIVKKVDTKRAVALIRKKLGNVTCDLHHQNCGWWRGRAVLFDW